MEFATHAAGETRAEPAGSRAEPATPGAAGAERDPASPPAHDDRVRLRRLGASSDEQHWLEPFDWTAAGWGR